MKAKTIGDILEDRAPRSLYAKRKRICETSGDGESAIMRPCIHLSSAETVLARKLDELAADLAGKERPELPEPVPGGRWCGQCKCYLPVKRSLRVFHCPLGRW
jgi:hypothetical protein